MKEKKRGKLKLKDSMRRAVAIFMVITLAISSNIIPVFAETVSDLTISPTFTTGTAEAFETGNTYNLDIDVSASNYETPIIKITVPKNITVSYYPTQSNNTTIAQNVTSTGVTKTTDTDGNTVIEYNLKEYTNTLGFNITLAPTHLLTDGASYSTIVELYNGTTQIASDTSDITVVNNSVKPGAFYVQNYYNNSNAIIRNTDPCYVDLQLYSRNSYSNHFPYEAIDIVVPLPSEINALSYYNGSEYVDFVSGVEKTFSNGTMTYYDSYSFTNAAGTEIATGKAVVYHLGPDDSYVKYSTSKYFYNSNDTHVYMKFNNDSTDGTYYAPAQIKATATINGSEVIMQDFSAPSSSYRYTRATIKHYELSDDLFVSGNRTSSYGYPYVYPIMDNTYYMSYITNKTGETINDLVVEYNIPSKFHGCDLHFNLESYNSSYPSSAIVEYKTISGGDTIYTKNITQDDPDLIIEDTTDGITYMKVTYDKLDSYSNAARLFDLYVVNSENISSGYESITTKILSGTGEDVVGAFGEQSTYSYGLNLFLNYNIRSYARISNTSLNKGDSFFVYGYSDYNAKYKNPTITVMIPKEYIFMGYREPSQLSGATYTLTTTDVTVTEAMATTAIPAGEYTKYTVQYNDDKEYTGRPYFYFDFKIGPLVNTSVLQTGLTVPAKLTISTGNEYFPSYYTTMTDIYDLDNDGDVTDLSYYAYSYNSNVTINAARAVTFDPYLISSDNTGENSIQYYQYDSEGTYKYYMYNGLADNNIIDSTSVEFTLPKTSTTITGGGSSYTSKWSGNLTGLPTLTGDFLSGATVEYMYEGTDVYVTTAPSTTEELNSVIKIKVTAAEGKELDVSENAIIEIPFLVDFEDNTTVSDYAYFGSKATYTLNGVTSVIDNTPVNLIPKYKTITGTIYNDYNGNQTQDSNETNNSKNFNLYLYQGSDTTGTLLSSINSNYTTGAYSFNVLHPGTYTIKLNKSDSEYYPTWTDDYFDDNGCYTFTLGNESTDAYTNINLGIIAPRTLSLNMYSVTVVENTTRKIVPTIAPILGEGENVTYTSSDTSVVTVDEDGILTFAGEGTATITVSVPQLAGILSINSEASTTVERTVSVTTQKDGCFITADPYISTSTNETDEFTQTELTYSPSGASDYIYYVYNRDGYCNDHTDTKSVSWEITSDNSDYATLTTNSYADYGRIYFTATKAGTYTIKATETWSHLEENGPDPIEFTIVVNKANQSGITINGSSTLTYGDAGVGYTATGGTTGGTVSWEVVSGTAATVNPSTGALSIKGVGTVTIKATMAGNDNYNSVSATKTITINKKTLSVTTASKFIYYGMTAEDLTLSVTGFAYGETALTASGYTAPTITITAPSEEGEYTIYASGGSADNYTFTYSYGTYTIDRRNPQYGQQYTITVEEGDNGYFTSDFTISALDGYLVSEEEDGTYSQSITKSDDTDNGYLTVYVKDISGENEGEIYDPLEGDYMIDQTMPAISGVADGSTNYGAVTVQVTDSNLTDVYLDGEVVTLDGDNKFKIDPVNGIVTVEAYDLAGNCTTYSFGVYEIYTVTLPTETTGYTVSFGEGYDSEVNYDGMVEIILTLEDGYSTLENYILKVNGTGYEPYSVSDSGKEITYRIENIKSDSTVTVEGVADITSPIGKISVEENEYVSRLNDLTFELFFNKTVDVTITASDVNTGSGLGSLGYYVSDKELTEEEILGITEWIPITSGESFSIDPDNKYVIYARFADNAGNTVYINSNGLVLDGTNPVIAGVENEGVYYGEQTASVSDEFTDIAKVLLNGEEVTLDESGDINIKTSIELQTLYIEDLAGNSTEYSFYVYPQFEISYNDNVEAENIEVGNTQTKNYNVDLTINEIIPVRTGYTFKEWNTKADGTGDGYLPSGIISVNENTVLYAVWSPNTNTKLVINHYVMNTNGEYPLLPTVVESKTGTTATTLTAKDFVNKKLLITNGIYYDIAKTNNSAVTTFVVKADGTTVVNLYYKRSVYELKAIKGTGISTVTGSGKYYYGQTVIVSGKVLSGYLWSGWISSDTTKLLNSKLMEYTFKMPASPITFTANATKVVVEEDPVNEPEIKTYKVSGDVKDEDSNPVSGAQVVIKAGAVAYGSTVTDDTGKYVISGIKPGYYNIVITKDDMTVTKVILITEKDFVAGIATIPSGKKNSIVDVKDDAPEAVADGVDNLLKEENIVEDNDKGMTEEDNKIVEDGGSVEMKLVVDKIEKEESEDADDIEEAMEGTNDKMAVLMDLSVIKTVVDIEGSLTSTKLIELPQLISIRMEIPDEFKNMKSYKIYRYHIDGVDIITETPNEDGEYITVEDGYIEIFIKKFSTYALSYEEPDEEVIDDSVESGDTFNFIPYVLLMGTALITYSGITLKKRKKTV